MLFFIMDVVQKDTLVQIDTNLCEACGVCSEVCPRHIPVSERTKSGKTTYISSERHELCMQCGHCMAVCPNDAITVKGLKYGEFETVNPPDIHSEDLLSFMKHRRSVRRYKKKSIPRAVIKQIVEAVQVAPTGTGRSSTGLITIDDPESLSRLSKLLYKSYETLERNLKNPLARLFIRRKAGKRTFRTLENFVIPGMYWYIRWFREGRSNEILRDCPALMLFHSAKYEPVGHENCIAAAFHAIFEAQTLNIGTCFNDLIPPMCNRTKDIRNLLDLPADREVYASITMGYPKYKFKKIIPRRLSEVRFI